jgi:hypothetical protein
VGSSKYAYFSFKVRKLSYLADEFDSCLTLQLAPPSGKSCFRMNNYMFIVENWFYYDVNSAIYRNFGHPKSVMKGLRLQIHQSNLSRQVLNQSYTYNGLRIEPQLFKVALVEEFICNTFCQEVLLLPRFGNGAYITGCHQHSTKY